MKKIESRKDTILTSIEIHDLIVTHVGKMLLYNTFGNGPYLVSILGIYQWQNGPTLLLIFDLLIYLLCNTSKDVCEWKFFDTFWP